MNSKQELTGQLALITGASRGIGAAIAERLAAAGAEVLLTGRSERALEALVERIRVAGGMAAYRVTDFGDPDAVAALIETVRAEYGRLDVLVNNAGIAESIALTETSLEAWDRHMAVNVRAPFMLSTRLVDLLERSTNPVIVNIGSVVSYKGYPNQGAYTASKHAVLGLSKVLAKELHSRNIRVHTVSPGGVSTDMIREVRPDIDPSDLMAPEEIAETILFLVLMRGNAVIDEVVLRRRKSEPWR